MPTVKGWVSRKAAMYESSELSTEVHIGSTGNCQLAVVAYAEDVFDEPSIKKRREIFFDMYRCSSKPLLLIDVCSYVCRRVTNTFKKNEIVLRKAYISSNRSNMTLFIIRPSKD